MKFLYGILAFLALVAAALFLVPPRTVGEWLRPEITERLEAIAGRALSIEGDIAVSLLPSPRMTVTDLRVPGASGAAAPDMARIESLELELALGPLFGGEIAVSSLVLAEPTIEIERLADGRFNWFPEGEAGLAPASAATAADAEALEIARIEAGTIENGTIVYRRGGGRPAERIERIDATFSATSRDGPFRAEGRFARGGAVIGFQLLTNAIGERRAMPLWLETTVGDERGRALLEGTASDIDGTLSFDGAMEVEAPDLGALLTALGIDPGAMAAAPLADAFSAKGELVVRAGSVAVRELQLRLGKSQADGDIAWQDGDTPRVEATIEINRVDLDRFLPAAGGMGAESPSADTGGAEAAAVPSVVARDIRQTIPGDIAAEVDLTIDTLAWREGVIRQVKVPLKLDGGAVAIREGTALLPGGAAVSLSGWLTKDDSGPWLGGVAEIVADDLRAVLAWLDVDVGAVPADRLRRLDAIANLSASGGLISASELDISIDTTRLTGNVDVEMGRAPRLSANLRADAVNIDAYLRAADPSAAAGAVGAADEIPEPDSESGSDGFPAALAGIDADVTLEIDSLTYDGVRLAGLDLDATLNDDMLTVRRAAVADVAGARVALTGTARAVRTSPDVALDIEGEAASLAGVAALLDIDPAIRSEAVGAIELHGSLKGDEDALNVDLTVNSASAGVELKLKGPVRRPFGSPSVALALDLRAADAAALARIAGISLPAAIGRLGALTMEGDIDFRGETAREAVGSLAGRMHMTFRNGAVDGVDLPAIGRQIDALAALDTLDDIPSFVAAAERSLSSGQTAVHSLGGDIAIQDGEARIEEFKIDADGADGDLEGSADLTAWQIDLTALFRLDEHPEAPPVGVRLAGPIDRPGRHYLIEDMQAHLVKLGLLSLARSQSAPAIALRKGAKAEPGTALDRMLRDRYGDPEEAKGGGGRAAPPPDAVVVEGEAAPAAGQAEEMEEGPEPGEGAGLQSLLDDVLHSEEAEAADDEEASAAPAPAPEHDGGVGLRNFLDDMDETLRSEEAAGMEAVDGEEASAAPAPVPEHDGGVGLRNFLDDMDETLRSEEAVGTEAADGEEASAAPAPGPEHDRGANLRNFLDDTDDMPRSLDR